MQFIEDIEDGTGLSEETLYRSYGIEVTEPLAGESAIIVSDELYATYDVPIDVQGMVEDILFIIREGIFK